ncbi:MAG: fibronectin type III domain-containing protein, partial [Clostridia bacterium]|nr:fibronectin type III domain-containing protein [Clostridia bacterium]
MNKLKKFLSLALALLMCASIVPVGVIGVVADDEISSHVYMIVTNPGEDCTTQMRIGFHSDYTYTDCYVELTLADDPRFLHPVKINGTYDDQKYIWFYNRLTTNALSENRFATKFLDWGVELEDLTPDTDYIYRVCDGEGGYSDTYSFKTAGADEYTIIWMSDAHVNADYVGRLNAWVNMFKYAESVAKYDVAFQFSTGDTTTSGDRYADWQAVYDQDFVKNYMLANVVGNHDVYDSIMDDDTVYYTQYWKSGQYFEIVNNNPVNGFTANSQRINGYLNSDGYTDYANQSANHLFAVDSGLLSGKQISGGVDDTSGRKYWFNYNGILFIIFDYYSMMFAEDTKNALEWAGKVIEDNYGKYDYIICADHVNLINGGSGTFRDYGACDYDFFGPFFDKYGVDIFLAGDNHVYLHTDAIYNGAVSTDPSKGTYIVQAPCLSRPQANITAYDAAGFALKQYSVAGTTVGGLTIDVDESGLTFNCLVYEMLGTTPYYCYDSFTIPKREKAPAAQLGLYAFNEPTVLYTSPSEEYAFLESGAFDYLAVCVDTYMNYGLFDVSPTPIWCDVSNATYLSGCNTAPIGKL